jgi:hypothetical protein
MARWYGNATAIANKSGLAIAQGWIRKNVPEQLQPVIEKNVRLRK